MTEAIAIPDLPDLTYLRKLLGSPWVDANVFGNNTAAHRLGLWQKKDPYNPWVKYTERLVKGILTCQNIRFKDEVLANKLKSKTDFVSTITEMESATFLAEQGFTVTLEPTAPQKGPDIQAEWQGIPYFIEIRTVGFPKDEDRRNSVTNEIFGKLSGVRSSYSVGFIVAPTYKPGSRELSGAIKSVLNSLGALKELKAKSATLYYAGKDEVLLVRPGVSLTAKHIGIMQKAEFEARFTHSGKEHSGTPASFFEKKKVVEPVKDHERLKKILDDKRDQLPTASRGIIVLEVSELFMLSEFSIMRALYGDVLITFPRVQEPGGDVAEGTQTRNNRGFFGRTSRVSAVIIQRRKTNGTEIANEWNVYPTNRANADTIRLMLVELERFGDVGDRKNLSADNTP